MKRANPPTGEIKKEMKKVNPLSFFPKPKLDLKKIENKSLLKDHKGEKIRISSWNVNGVRAVIRKTDLESYIKKTDLDILCLNETKINKKKFEKDRLEE